MQRRQDIQTARVSVDPPTLVDAVFPLLGVMNISINFPAPTAAMDDADDPEVWESTEMKDRY